MKNRKILCTFLIAIILLSLIVPEISAKPKNKKGRKNRKRRHSTAELSESNVIENANPVVVFIRAEGPRGRLNPAGTIGIGSTVHMYTHVTDNETDSASLTVNIRYRRQRGKWTTVAASYSAPNNYWYVDWSIPGGADLGLYDVKVDVFDGDGSSATATDPGEYDVI